jgi:hypothetical protein
VKKLPLVHLFVLGGFVLLGAFSAIAQFDVNAYSSVDLQKYALHASRGCILGKLTSGDEGASVKDLCAYAIQYIREIERRRGYR